MKVLRKRIKQLRDERAEILRDQRRCRVEMNMLKKELRDNDEKRD